MKWIHNKVYRIMLYQFNQENRNGCSHHIYLCHLPFVYFIGSTIPFLNWMQFSTTHKVLRMLGLDDSYWEESRSRDSIWFPDNDTRYEFLIKCIEETG